MNSRAAVVLLGAALAGGCSSVRWSGSPPREFSADALHPPPPEDRVPRAPLPAPSRPTSTGRPAAVVVPSASETRRREALFPSDLGPDDLDVTAYPVQRRRQFEVYAGLCSRCHSLARSLNAPPTSRRWWKFYFVGMRARSSLRGRTIPREEADAALDFLEFDERERKATAAFAELTAELDARFDALVAERMGRLQGAGQPEVLRPGP